MLQEIITLQEKFDPYLRQGDYTFIGPEDFEHMENFIKIASHYAPGRFFGNTIHNVLSNKKAIMQTLEFIEVPVRIYAVDRTMDVLAPMTWEELLFSL